MSVGQNIRARRKELGMNAETLAELLGLAPTTIYRYENGAIEKVDAARLIPIAEALRTTPAYLMGLDENHFEQTNKSEANESPKTQEARTVSGWMDDLPETQRKFIENLVATAIRNFPS